MFDGNRSEHTKTGLIAGGILAALIAIAFIGWGLWQSAEYQRQANDQTSKYAAYTDQEIRQTCVGSASADKANCIAKARNEQRGNQRNEQDLVAQRQSALWAYIMGAAAVIGMGLSVIGVFLVWTTFRETRQANVIAREAMEAQTRPWIRLAARPYRSRREGTTVKASVTVRAENVGNAPANYVSLVPTILDGEWSTPRILNAAPNFFDDGRASQNAPVRDLNLHDRILFQQEEWNYDCKVEATNFPEDCRVGCMVVALRYNAPDSAKARYTILVFDMAWRKGFKTTKSVRAEVDVMSFEERASFSAYAD